MHDNNQISNPSSAPFDIMAALRGATARRHEILDSGMPLSRSDPTLADYRDHLILLRAWLAPLETWLADFKDGPQDKALLAPVSRTALIDADLADPATPKGGIAPAAPMLAISAGNSAAYRWGVLYVIEGSQLGGTVLYRRLADRLAPHPLRYLSGDGVPPGPRWGVFMAALRAEVRSGEQIAQACDGACHAFDALLEIAGLAR